MRTIQTGKSLKSMIDFLVFSKHCYISCTKVTHITFQWFETKVCSVHMLVHDIFGSKSFLTIRTHMVSYFQMCSVYMSFHERLCHSFIIATRIFTRYFEFLFLFWG